MGGCMAGQMGVGWVSGWSRRRSRIGVIGTKGGWRNGWVEE